VTKRLALLPADADLLERWDKSMAEAGRPEATRRTYLTVARRLSRAHADGLGTIGPVELDAWLDACHLTPEMRSNYEGALSKLFTFAEDEGDVIASPMRLLRTVGPSPTADLELELIEQFDQARERAGLNYRTRHTQTRMLLSFARHLAPTSLVRAVPDDVATWMASSSAKAASSRYNLIGALHGFYTWTTEQGLTGGDPSLPFTRWQHRGLDFGDHIELSRNYRTALERKGLTRGTVYKYMCELRLLHGWAGERSVLDLSTEDIERWLDTRRLSSNSRAASVSCAWNFYRWAVRAGLTDHNPAEAIDRPKVRLGVPRPIGDDDLARALDGATGSLKAWMLLAAYQGLRCQEIAGLCREDVVDTVEPPMLVVRRGKGGKQRLLPLHPAVAAELAPLRGSGLLWPETHRSDAVKPAWFVSHTINEYLHGLGIDSTAHKLRHWFGTQTYRESQDLRMVQELLGHSSPTTTAVYAAWSPGKAVPVVTGLRAAGRQS